MCKAELNRNKKTLLTVFIGITISMVFIIGSSNSLLNIALSKSSHHSKSSTATTNGLGISSGSGNSGSTIKGTNSSPSISTGKSSSITNNSVVSNNKVVVLSFDDNRIGDFTYAKPILDKYGFKATFFVICGKTTDSGAMNWQDIARYAKGWYGY